MGDTVSATAGIVEYSLFEPQRGSNPQPTLVLLQLEKGVGVSQLKTQSNRHLPTSLAEGLKCGVASGE